VFTVAEHTAEIDGLPIFWRSAQGTGTPTLYLHGVPSSSDDWVAPREHEATRPWVRRWWRRKRPTDRWTVPPPFQTGFLERSGGVAVDLPGFGRSGKPGYLRYTIDEYSAFVERFLDHLEIERLKLVVHDWGAVGLVFAQAHPERVERLVITNAVPLLGGYRWHRTARLWRTPGLGELVMGASTRRVLRRGTRTANASGPLPEAYIDSVVEHFDEGTRRAILRLYRSSPPAALERAGENLSKLEMPALVVWGARDPYIPLRFGREYARRLPSAQLIELDAAGHFWWLEQPQSIARVVEFLQDGGE
jgi:pimeloyl-ACP methyl ester carboxylesterase